MAIVDLINQTALKLANGDPIGAKRIADIIASGNFEEISNIADYLNVPAEELAALPLGKPISSEFLDQTQMSTDDQIQSEVAKRTQSGLAQKLNDIYSKLYQQGIEGINQQYNPIRKRQISEERALGRLNSPSSIPGLSRIDDAQGQAIANFSSGLAGQRAGQEIGIAQAIENMLQNERQFGKTFAENKRQSALNRNFQKTRFNKENVFRQGEIDLNKALGERALYEQGQSAKREKEAAEPGTLDYINTAFSGLGALGSVAGGSGGIGSLLSSFKSSKPKIAGIGG